MVIQRDLNAAASPQYDVIVVGGGIYGICLALEAARRGLTALMVEKNDFGAGVSWNSLRILHGGLRYLQKMDMIRYFESVGERRWFLQHFPDVCGALPCMMPLYGSGLRRASVMRIALAMNDALSCHRNRNVPNECRLDNGRIISAKQAGEMFPLVDKDGLEAAALWFDGQIRNSPRLSMELCRWAASEGAVLLNHVEATGLETDGGVVTGLRAIDRIGGTEINFRAAKVINAAGPWSESFSEKAGEKPNGLFSPALAFNVLFDRPPMAETAVAVTAKEDGARTYFLHNEGSYLLGGTYHAAIKEPHATEGRGEWLRGLVRDYIKQVNRGAPGLNLREEQVLRVYAGRLPAKVAGEEEPGDKPKILDHGGTGGVRGFWSVSGVKYTTARLVAEQTVNAVFPDKKGHSKPISRTPTTDPALNAMSDEAESLPVSQLISCAVRIRDEEAVTGFGDLMLRRTAWALNPEIGQRIARKIGPELGYSMDQIDACCTEIGDRVFKEKPVVAAAN